MFFWFEMNLDTNNPDYLHYKTKLEAGGFQFHPDGSTAFITVPGVSREDASINIKAILSKAGLNFIPNT